MHLPATKSVRHIAFVGFVCTLVIGMTFLSTILLGFNIQYLSCGGFFLIMSWVILVISKEIEREGRIDGHFVLGYQESGLTDLSLLYMEKEKE